MPLPFTASLGRHVLRPTLETSRVNQLDADLLDEELEHMLAEPLWAALAPVFGADWRPELRALLRIVIVRSSLERSASYGAQLQNLRWTQADSGKALSRTQISACALLSVLPAYIGTRLRDRMLSSGWADCPPPPCWSSLFSEPQLRRKRYLKRLIWDASERIEQIYASVKLLNLLIFFYNGKYRSITERVLGIRLVHARRSAMRNVSFEFLNRQLVWETVTDFVLFILPFINVRRVQLYLAYAKAQAQVALKRLFIDSRSVPASNPTKEPSISESKGAFSHLANDLCPICTAKHANPTSITSSVINPNDPMSYSNSIPSLNHADDRLKIPYRVNCCGGLYCYYCVAGEIIVWRESNLDRRWNCWRCGREVTAITRWTGDRQGAMPQGSAQLDGSCAETKS